MPLKILPTVTVNAQQLGYRSSFVGAVVLGAVITNIFLNICSQIRVSYTNNPAEVDSDFIKAGYKYSATLV